MALMNAALKLSVTMLDVRRRWWWMWVVRRWNLTIAANLLAVMRWTTGVDTTAELLITMIARWRMVPRWRWRGMVPRARGGVYGAT